MAVFTVSAPSLLCGLLSFFRPIPAIFSGFFSCRKTSAPHTPPLYIVFPCRPAVTAPMRGMRRTCLRFFCTVLVFLPVARHGHPKGRTVFCFHLLYRRPFYMTHHMAHSFGSYLLKGAPISPFLVLLADMRTAYLPQTG